MGVRVVGVVAPSLALALALALALPTASAHAELVASTPPSGGHLAVGATTLTLVFSEALERTAFTSATVRSMTEGPLATTTEIPTIQPDVLVVHVPPLPQGGYVLEWRALSVDGHTSSGATPFAVGSASAPTIVAPAAPSDALGSASESAARVALLAGLLVATGAPLFLRGEGARRGAIALVVATALAAAGAIALVVLFAARIGADLGAAVGTAPGTVLAAQAAAALVAVALAIRGKGGVAVAAFVALSIHAASGHGLAASTDLGSHHASLVLGIAHLGAAAVWVGGIAALLLRPRADARATLADVRRFSPWAMASVALVAATGLLEAWATLPSWGDLVSSAYGRLVLTKGALLLVLVGFGALHQLVLAPRLERAAATPRGTARALRAEAAVMGAVIVVAGLLGATAPPGV